MDLYSVAVFVHVVAAILVVGGSFAVNILGTRVGKVRTVDALRHSLGSLELVGKTIPPSSAVVLLTGLYLATSGGWWSQGWLVVALLLFIASGATAGTVLEPAVKRSIAAAADLPEGPMTPEIGARIMQPVVPLVGNVLVGADLAIVFLMTNKPGYPGAVTTAAVGLAIGLGLALRTRQQLAAARPAGTTAAGAAPSPEQA